MSKLGIDDARKIMTKLGIDDARKIMTKLGIDDAYIESLHRKQNKNIFGSVY